MVCVCARVLARALMLSADSSDVTAGTALSRAVSKSWDRSARRRARSTVELTHEAHLPFHATGKKFKSLRVPSNSVVGREVRIILRETEASRNNNILLGVREIQHVGKVEKFCLHYQSM